MQCALYLENEAKREEKDGLPDLLEAMKTTVKLMLVYVFSTCVFFFCFPCLWVYSSVSFSPPNSHRSLLAISSLYTHCFRFLRSFLDDAGAKEMMNIPAFCEFCFDWFWVFLCLQGRRQWQSWLFSVLPLPFSFSLWICAFSLCISALFLFCGFLGFFCLCFWVGFFSSLLCFWVFLVFWVLFFFPPSLSFFFCFSLPLFHSLRSVFIVSESLRLWETKFQSNSFSFLKFEFD